VKCYIVRVYREEQGSHQEFAGVVEMVGAERSKAFSTFDEFCEIVGPVTRKRGRGAVAGNETIQPRTPTDTLLDQAGNRKRKGFIL
jgi:hypothetical protein